MLPVGKNNIFYGQIEKYFEFVKDTEELLPGEGIGLEALLGLN